MIGYMGVLGDIMGNLEFGEGEMNLRNRLVEKCLEAEYRLTKLRGAILDMRGDLKYLRKALDHIYWPEKSLDFRYERPEAVKNLAELLREQTVQHWYNRSANAVRAAVKRE